MVEYINTIKNKVKYVTIRWKNVPYIPFAIRRVIMAELPCIALKVDTSKAGTNYKIYENGSTFKNQDLMLRLALTPHCFKNSVIEKWIPGKFKCSIDVVNNTNVYRKVYSSDIKVYKSTGLVEWLQYNESVFPPDPSTGDYVELTVLPPNGKLSLEWYPELGSTYDHAAFAAASSLRFSTDDNGVTELTFASECGLSNSEIIDNAFGKLINDLVTIKRGTTTLTSKAVGEWEAHLENTRLTVTGLVQTWCMQHIIKKKCKHLQTVGYSDVHPLETTSVLFIGAVPTSTEAQVKDELISVVTDLMQHLDDQRIEILSLSMKIDRKHVPATVVDETESEDVDEAANEEDGEDFGHTISAAGLNLCPREEGYRVQFDSNGQLKMEQELIRAKEYRNLIVKFANEVPKYMDITAGHLLKTNTKRKLSLAADVVQRCILAQVWVRNVTDIDPLFIYTDNPMFRSEMLSNMTTIYKGFIEADERHIDNLDPLGHEFKVHSKKELDFICTKLSKLLLELIEKAAIATATLIGNITIVPSNPVVKFIKKTIDKNKVVVPVIIWHTGNKRAINSFNHPHLGIHDGVIVVQYTGPKAILLRDPWAAFTSFFRYNYIEIGNQSLQKVKDEVDGIDGFSTPFNTHNPHFCSAYPDIDGPLGALAEFHTFCNGVADGSFDLSKVGVRHFAVNPPFVEAVMDMCLEHIIRMLKGERERGHKWTCSYIIPNWKDSKAYRDLAALAKSPVDGLSFEFKNRDDMKFRNAFTGESDVTLGKTKIVQGLFKNY